MRTDMHEPAPHHDAGASGKIVNFHDAAGNRLADINATEGSSFLLEVIDESRQTVSDLNEVMVVYCLNPNIDSGQHWAQSGLGSRR